jgi:hypothetical protein
VTRTCPTCGKEFEGVRGRRFCSKSCWPSRRPFAAPGPVASDAPPTWDELTDLLWEAARRGSIAAMAILRREMRGEPGEARDSIVDQLARRRKEER